MSRSLQSPAYNQLRRLLTDARNTAGLTQTQVAEKLGRPQSFVSKWEGAERHLDVIEFLALCEAVGVPATDVIASLDPPFWLADRLPTTK